MSFLFIDYAVGKSKVVKENWTFFCFNFVFYNSSGSVTQHHLFGCKINGNGPWVCHIYHLIVFVYRNPIQSSKFFPFNFLQKVLKLSGFNVESNQPLLLRGIEESRVIAGKCQPKNSSGLGMTDNGSSWVALGSDSHNGTIDETGIDGPLTVDFNIFRAAEMGVVGDDSGLLEVVGVDVGLECWIEGRDVDVVSLVLGVVLAPGLLLVYWPGYQAQDEY